MTSKILSLLAASVLTVLLAACGGGGGGSGQSPTSQPTTPPPAVGIIGDGRLGELVEWARASEDVPAMALVLVQGGQIAEFAAVGRRSMSENTRVTTNDRWHLGSLTKAMTATLAGVLVDQSVIGWQTTPLDVWPGLDQSIHFGFRDITLKQLLSHTSGMTNAGSVPQAFLDNATGTLIEKRRQWAAQLLADAPALPAGLLNYSNWGYVVAGAMLETVTGTPYETLLEQQVLGPLGMNDTSFGAPGTPGQTDEPWGHWDLGNSFEPISPGPGADNPQVLGPAGTVHSTLSDYAQFMMAHIAGARGIPGLVTVPTFQTLHTPVVSGSALGWGVLPDDSGVQGIILSHDGSNVRWYAAVRLAPAADVGALIVTNAAGRAEEAIDLLGDLLTERFQASQ